MKRANGEGALYYDQKRGYWRATITLPNGKRKDFCSKNRNIAIQKRNYFMEGKYKLSPVLELSIIECCEKYLEMMFNQKKFGESTYRTNLETLKRLRKSELSELPVSTLSVKNINDFLKNEGDKGMSDSILKKDKFMLKWGFLYAKEMKLIQDSPMDSLLLERVVGQKREKVKALTQDEQSKFFKALKVYNEKPYVDIWLLAIFTGMRIGEICALSYDDIDFENKTIYVQRTLTRDIIGRHLIGNTTKTTNGKRIIQYSDVVETLLTNIKKIKKDNTNLVFSDGFGNFVHPTRNAEKLRKFNRIYNIGERLTMHMFRHTFATRMIEQNIPAYAVQHLLGHSSVDITLDTYTDFFENQRKKYTDKIDNYWSEVTKPKIVEG